MKINKKKIILIISILLGIILISSVVYAKGIDTLLYNPFVGTTPGAEENGAFLTKAGKILGYIRWIGTAIAVVTMVFIGVKYMLASIEEKAEYKNTAIMYITGCVILLCGSQLTNMIGNIFTTVVDDNNICLTCYFDRSKYMNISYISYDDCNNVFSDHYYDGKPLCEPCRDWLFAKTTYYCRECKFTRNESYRYSDTYSFWDNVYNFYNNNNFFCKECFKWIKEMDGRLCTTIIGRKKCTNNCTMVMEKSPSLFSMYKAVTLTWGRDGASLYCDECDEWIKETAKSLNGKLGKLVYVCPECKYFRNEYYSVDDLRYSKDKMENLPMCEECTDWYNDKMLQLTDPYYDYTCKCGFVRAFDKMNSKVVLEEWVGNNSSPTTCDECKEWINLMKQELWERDQEMYICSCGFAYRGRSFFSLNNLNQWVDDAIVNGVNICEDCSEWIENKRKLFKIVNDGRTSWK